MLMLTKPDSVRRRGGARSATSTSSAQCCSMSLTTNCECYHFDVFGGITPRKRTRVIQISVYRRGFWSDSLGQNIDDAEHMSDHVGDGIIAGLYASGADVFADA